MAAASGGGLPAHVRKGHYVDVLDTSKVWMQASVEEVYGSKVLIHYTFWSSRWDEWISADSERIQPYNSRIYHRGGPLTPGLWVDVELPPGAMGNAETEHKEASILEARYPGASVAAPAAQPSSVNPPPPAVGFGPSGIRVWVKTRYVSGGARLDVPVEWLHPYGVKTRLEQPFKPNKQVYWRVRKRAEQRMVILNNALRAYCLALGRLGFRLEPMGGDGNCLFRSVAHQIYGEQELHELLRSSAADYMEAERDWFSAFTVGTGEEQQQQALPDQPVSAPAGGTAAARSFEEYIAAIRVLGEWGDDPEIQALCELYNRPAEIWAFDPVHGARKLRTLHSTRYTGSRPPIRLSYFGGSHYDSIVGVGWEENLLKTAPGAAEVQAIRRARARGGRGRGGGAAGAAGGAGGGAALSAADEVEAAELQQAVMASRRAFDEEEKQTIEMAMQSSIRDSRGSLSRQQQASAGAVLPPPSGQPSLARASSGVAEWDALAETDPELAALLASSAAEAGYLPDSALATWLPSPAAAGGASSAAAAAAAGGAGGGQGGLTLEQQQVERALAASRELQQRQARDAEEALTSDLERALAQSRREAGLVAGASAGVGAGSAAAGGHGVNAGAAAAAAAGASSGSVSDLEFLTYEEQVAKMLEASKKEQEEREAAVAEQQLLQLAAQESAAATAGSGWAGGGGASQGFAAGAYASDFDVVIGQEEGEDVEAMLLEQALLMSTQAAGGGSVPAAAGVAAAGGAVGSASSQGGVSQQGSQQQQGVQQQQGDSRPRDANGQPIEQQQSQQASAAAPAAASAAAAAVVAGSAAAATVPAFLYQGIGAAFDGAGMDAEMDPDLQAALALSMTQEQ